MKKASDFDFVDKIIFINLDRRKDRLKEINKNLKFLIDIGKVYRLSAVEDNNPEIGCTKSHLSVLKYAKEQSVRNVLILEDDILWNDKKYDEALHILKKIINTDPNYSVIHLGGMGLHYGGFKYDKTTFRLYKSWGTHAYLVNGYYISTLIKCWENFDKDHTSIDNKWHVLMQKDPFYVVVPTLIYQSGNDSDIQPGGGKDANLWFELYYPNQEYSAKTYPGVL